jgi:parallel beta-helix repeat protein
LKIIILIITVAFLLTNSSRGTGIPKTGLENSEALAQTYTPHSPIHIDGNADFLAQDAIEGWPGNGSLVSPISISGYSFAAAEHMLRVENSDLHFEFVDNQLDGISYEWCGVACINSANGVIKDNYVERAAAGIHVVTVENYTIIGNEVRDSWFAGLVVEDGSVNVTLENNLVYENGDYGIHIGNPYGSATSHDVKIIGNTVFENTPSGIILLEADGCIVDKNEVCNNTLNGIEVREGSHEIKYNNVSDCKTGILVVGGNSTITGNEVSGVEYALSVSSENNTITNNELTNNEKIGLRFFYSYTDGTSGSNNVVKGNIIANNSRWGIEIIGTAEDNKIEGNYFFMNGETCQSTDDGSNNVFDGNYWDDWTTPDVNNDGIVDAPYAIEGDSENSDAHPMSVPDIWIYPWFSGPCGCENETTTTEAEGETLLVDPLLLTIGISVVVVVMVISIFIRKR